MSYDPEKKTWVSKAWPNNRPLFREETIKGNSKKIIIAEGEKAVVEAEKKIEFTQESLLLLMLQLVKLL